MRKYLRQLQQIPLFDGIEFEDMESILACLGGRVKEYSKNQIIFDEGERIEDVGILLSGNIQIVKDDVEGNRNIMKELDRVGAFAEALSFAALPASPFRVLTTQNSRVLFLPLRRIINICPSACSFHTRMITNALHSLAQQNISITQKLNIVSQRTLRKRLWSYLCSEAQTQGSQTFVIQFNRSELADFLCVDRSALSRELTKMAGEGLIEFDKNCFTLLDLHKNE